MAAVDDPKIRATLGKKNPIAVIAGAGVEVHHITGVEGPEALVIGDVVEGDHKITRLDLISSAPSLFNLKSHLCRR